LQLIAELQGHEITSQRYLLRIDLLIYLSLFANPRCSIRKVLKACSPSLSERYLLFLKNFLSAFEHQQMHTITTTNANPIASFNHALVKF
jgi:hypothetical protein